MRLGGLVLGVLIATVAAIVGPVVAYADEAPAWSRGVTDAQKAAAQKLLDAGNTLFVEHDYIAALDRYRQAIAAWDHPAIRFNIVRCLVQLDRPLEADDQLALALAYGAAPLEEAVYNEALAYQKLLGNQIAHIAVSCTQAGVLVTLDGKKVGACPGTVDTRVAPGSHQLVGTRDGYAPRTAAIVVVGGKRETVAMTLTPLATAAVVHVHRWERWKPWAVLASGAGVAALGGLVDIQATRDMRRYDDALVTACGGAGCSASRPIPADLADQKTSAQRETAVGVSLIGVGATAAIVGGVLLYLNRDRAVVASEHFEILPARGGAAVSLTGSF